MTRSQTPPPSRLRSAALRPDRRAVLLGGLSLAALGFGPPAQAADEFPAKPIRIISAFSAGTGGDAVVQHFAEALGRLSGVKVTVESRPGTFGSVAANYVRKAKADGYTIHIAPASATLAAAPALYKKVTFDPVQDFTPLAPLARLGVVFAVAPDSPAKSLDELTQILKKKGDAAAYGAVGTTSIVAAELYKKVAGLATTQTEYREMLTATSDMAAGKLDFVVGDTVWAMQQSKAKKIRLLAVSTPEPMGILPDVPPAAATLGKGFEPVTTWWAAVAPAKLPTTVTARYEKWFQEIAASPEIRKVLGNLGLDPYPGNTRMLETLLATDLRKWAEFVKIAKIAPQ